MSVPSQYCIYLRKSRADLEAEAHGEGETLARHERMLLELSKRLNLNITQIYREIVSGETIAARPVMQQLLAEVGAGMWSGVVVVEVERLARGDTMDQGLMAQTFKYSGTKIVTPMNSTRNTLSSVFSCPGVSTRPSIDGYSVGGLPLQKRASL